MMDLILEIFGNTLDVLASDAVGLNPYNILLTILIFKDKIRYALSSVKVEGGDDVSKEAKGRVKDAVKEKLRVTGLQYSQEVLKARVTFNFEKKKFLGLITVWVMVINLPKPKKADEKSASK